MTRVAIWAGADQVPLLRRAIDAGAFETPAIGCSDATGAVALSQALDQPVETDLRAVLSVDCDVIWMAAPRALDTDTRTMLRSVNCPVATSAPPPAALAELLEEPDGGMPATFIPLMRGGPTWAAAESALEGFGQIHCVHVSATAGDYQTSLRALLLDAVDLVTHLIGEPDEIWSAHAGQQAVSADPTAELSGHIAAAMRMGTKQAASLSISDGGGSWIRRVVLLGDGGRIIVTDAGVSWTDPEGVNQEAAPTENRVTAGELAAWHLKRLAEGRPQLRTTLAAAVVMETARLSCLTRQVEDPQQVHNMIGR